MSKRIKKAALAGAGLMLGFSLLATGVMAEENDSAGSEAEAVIKDETVYVLADASGKPGEIIVSDWLKNNGAQQLTDQSILQNIENIKGEESFTQDQDQLVWEAEGHDIWYQGTTEKELPVTVSASYFLDDQEVSPAEIAGKSGKVTIRYTFTNQEMGEAVIDENTYALHVPFAVVLGMAADPGVLDNVQVSGGKVVTDGEHSLVLGLAFPGLAEDLQTEAYAALTGLTQGDVPDTIEISADAENFRLGTVYFAVVNGLSLTSEEDMGSIFDEVMGKVSALKGGVDKLSEGVTSLKDGADKLSTGADALADGLGELTENNAALTEGAKQIFDTLLNSVYDQLTASGLEVGELTEDNYETVLDGLSKLVPGEGGEKIAAAKAQLDSVKAFYEGLIEYTDGVSSAKDGADQVSSGAASLLAGAKKLQLGTTVLKNAVPDFSAVSDALAKSVELGIEYNNYAGIAEDMEGKIRFIWKLAEIE